MCDYKLITKCKQCRGYVDNILDTVKLIEYLNYIYKKRLDIFNSKDCRDIKEYNSKFYDKRMSYIYIVLDEFADFYSHFHKLKSKVQSNLWIIKP
jgi:S-DNA-T family DNA segregation ATPase FtsK/SpoIIIE